MIISKNTIVELNNKKIKLLAGTSIDVDRNESLFVVDEDFKAKTNKGLILVESGDIVEISDKGDHTLISGSEFNSNGDVFRLEHGDRINIHEGQGWESFKAALKGKTRSEYLSEKLSKMQKVMQRIANKADRRHRFLNDRGRGEELTKILDTNEWEAFNEMAYAKSKEEIEDAFEDRGLDLPEMLTRLSKAFANVGEKNIALLINKVAPKGIIGKIGNFISNIVGPEQGSTTLERRPHRVGTIGDKEFVIQQHQGNWVAVTGKDGVPSVHKIIDVDGKSGIDVGGKKVPFDKIEMRQPGKSEQKASEPRVTEPRVTEPKTTPKSTEEKLKESEKIRLSKILNYIKSSGVKDFKKIIDYFGGDTNEEEIKKALSHGKKRLKIRKAPAAGKSKQAKTQAKATTK